MEHKIHKFTLNDLYILLDVNSSTLHILDKITFDILDVFTGQNHAEVMTALSGTYSADELQEALAELGQLMEQGLLFAPNLGVPMSFSEQPIVKSVCLHVAHDCNLRCGYCFAGTGDFGHDRGLMTAETARRAVDFLIAQSGPRRHCEIDFFGGEPLLNMDVVRETVAYVRQREAETGKIFKLTLTTNAVLLDQANIDFLNDNNISLVLSLDGRQEIHDSMRPGTCGEGSYEDVLRNITAAVNARDGQNYYLRGTFTAYNLDFAADVLDMADKGFKLLSVEPVVGKDVPYEIREEHLPQLFSEYEKLAEEYLRRKLVGNGFEFFHFNLDVHHGPCIAKRLSGCGAGHEYLAVTPDGDLYPCHQFVGREGFQLGTVWEGVTNTALPQQFRQTHVLNKEECRKCWARFYCSGGCHANAQLMHGVLDQPYAVGCELQKKRLECALMIQAKLALAQAGK